MAQLFLVRLPLASPSIMAGIKTSAVINVGTATLAALIGAKGLGDPILQGIHLLDNSLILQGAIPAAVLALLVQWGFDLLDRVVVPKGLRLPAEGNVTRLTQLRHSSRFRRKQKKTLLPSRLPGFPRFLTISALAASG